MTTKNITVIYSQDTDMDRKTLATALSQGPCRALPACHVLGTCCSHLLGPHPGFLPGALFLVCWMCPLRPDGTLHPTANLCTKANVVGCLNTAFLKAPMGTSLGKKCMKEQTRILQTDCQHDLSVIQEALQRYRISCMKPFFYLEGLAAPDLPARPHLGASQAFAKKRWTS